MTHKNSHGDKLFYGGKGCEVGADTPHARRKKGFANTSSRMSLVIRLAYEGLWPLAAN